MSSSVKYCVGVLIGIALLVYMNLERIRIYMIMSLINLLYFSIYEKCLSKKDHNFLLKVLAHSLLEIYSYILLKSFAIINRLFFESTFSNWFLLLYRYAVEFFFFSNLPENVISDSLLDFLCAQSSRLQISTVLVFSL